MQVIHSFIISSFTFTGHILHQQQRHEATAGGRGTCASTSSAAPGMNNDSSAVLDHISIWRTYFFKRNRIISIHFPRYLI